MTPPSAPFVGLYYRCLFDCAVEACAIWLDRQTRDASQRLEWLLDLHDLCWSHSICMASVGVTLKVLLHIFGHFHLKAAKNRFKDTFNFIL
jgi:hypothetical protein